MRIGPLRCTSLIFLASLLASSLGLEFSSGSSSSSSSKPVHLLDSFFRPRGAREPATPRQTPAGRAATRPAARTVELWKPSANMRLWEKIGNFYGAKDSTYAWPMALVHVNIMLYAFTYWLTRPVLPYLSKELGASPVVFGQFQTFFSSVGSPATRTLSIPRHATAKCLLGSERGHREQGRANSNPAPPTALQLHSAADAAFNCSRVAARLQTHSAKGEGGREMERKREID